MKILGILQNQWFQTPERARWSLEHQFKGDRERFIRTFLFHRCRTGRRLELVFGDLCDSIVWENASPVICGTHDGHPPADIAHLERVLVKHDPDIVITFGNIATSGILHFVDDHTEFVHLAGPHPMARERNTKVKLTELHLTLCHLILEAAPLEEE
jgi:hypothetical protein